MDIDPSCHSNTSRHFKIKNSFRSLTLGQIGCNLSHRKILKWLIDSSESIIAVLEDDVRVSSEFPKALETLLKAPLRFDIVFLGSRFTAKGLVNLVPLNDRFHLSLSKSREKGTWGYVITKEAAKDFLKILPEITGPIDDELHAYFLHGLKTFTLNPQIVFHEEEAKKFSYITENKLEKLILKEEIMRFASLFCEYYSHKKSFRKRIKSEKH